MTKSIHLIAILFFACALSCKDYPENVLPPDKMKFVFFDMMIADEFQNYYAGRDSLFNFDSIRVQNYLDILKLHKIDSNLFNQSIQYYKTNPVAFNVLIDSVTKYAEREREKRFQLEAAIQDSLTRITDSLANQSDTSAPVMDSIEKAN
ncbi:MAG: DUF4296 domain-containing protein [Chitinophagaceae bacterium]|jgi:hypothetical protein|nr:DUF4296 domain-containing protein [Chitinophagaceae bacterium]